MTFKIIKQFRIMFFKPMCNKMTLSTYPHSFRKIIVIPMVITKAKVFFSFTYFAAFIHRIWTFVLYILMISICISNAIFSHVISSTFSIIFSIVYSILSICFNVAGFTETIKPSWGMGIFRIFTSWKNLLAFITLFSFSHNSTFTYSIASPGTAFPHRSMGRRDFKFFSTNDTGFCYHTLLLPYILRNVKRYYG